MPLKILAADDSATMRKILQMTFAGEKAEVEAVATGEAALTFAQQHGADIILADASMKGMDGYALARAVKADPKTSHIAVIVLASQHNAYDAEKGKTAGVDDHVSKPFDTQALIDRVAEVLRRPRATGAGAAAASAAAMSRGDSGARPSPTAPPRAPAPPPRSSPPPRSAPPPAIAYARSASPPTPPPPAPRASDSPTRSYDDAAASIREALAGNGATMSQKLESLGLSQEQIEAVLALSREVVEQVVWEVVPDLAETLIREEIRRLTTEQ